MSDRPGGKIILYQRDGAPAIDVRMDGDTVWLSQQQLAELFGSSKQNISHHIRNIFDVRELPREGTVKGYLTVRREGCRGPSSSVGRSSHEPD